MFPNIGDGEYQISNSESKVYKSAKIFDFDQMPANVRSAFLDYVKPKAFDYLIEWPLEHFVGKFEGFQSMEYITVLDWFHKNAELSKSDRIIVEFNKL